VPGWPAAPVHLCLQALGRCDLLRPPAKFRLRRILRRLPPRTIVFPQKNQIVRCPTRGALALFARASTKPQDDASPSAAWSFHRDAVLTVRGPAGSCEQRVSRFVSRLQKRTLTGWQVA
jgi:hypothetical protein